MYKLLSTYEEIKAIIGKNLKKPYSVADFDIRTPEKDYNITITQGLSRKEKYKALIKETKGYRSNKDVITTIIKPTKLELFDSIQKVLKKIGFKESNPYGNIYTVFGFTESDSCTSPENLDLSENIEETDTVVDEIAKVFIDPSNDSFKALMSWMKSGGFDTLSEKDIEDLLFEARKITKKKNNEKFNNRLRSLEQAINSHTKIKQDIIKLGEISKNIENLRYKGSNKAVVNFIYNVIKDSKENIRNSKDYSHSINYYKNLENLVQNYSHILDALPVQKTRLTRAEYEHILNDLLSDLTVLEKENIKRYLKDIYFEIRDEEAMKKNKRIMYKVSTDTYTSSSWNNRFIHETLDAARNAAVSQKNAAIGHYTEISKVEVSVTGNIDSIGELIEVYTTNEILWDRLKNRDEHIQTALWYAKMNKEEKEDSFNSVVFEELRLHFKTPVSTKKIINLIKNKTEAECVAYIKNKISHATQYDDESKRVIINFI